MRYVRDHTVGVSARPRPDARVRFEVTEVTTDDDRTVHVRVYRWDGELNREVQLDTVEADDLKSPDKWAEVPERY